MKYLNFRSLSPLVLASSLVLPGMANAVIIEAGKDYFHTVSPTFFDFGGAIGVVNFEGGNTGPGNTDTIVERLEDTVDLAPGDSDMVDIEMVALSLVSTAPVAIGFSFFDVFVELDVGGPTLGTMTIKLDTAPDGTDLAEGTFDSVMNLNLDALFQEVGNPGNNFLIDIGGPLTGTGIPWSTTLTGKPEFQDEGPNFFLAGGTIGQEEHPSGGLHSFETAVPEPTSIALFGAGIAALGLRRRRQRAAS